MGVRLLVFLLAAAMSAACVHKRSGEGGDGATLGPSPVQNPGPTGPPEMTIYVTRLGPESYSLRFGGTIKTGLERQPAEDDPLHDLLVYEYSCGSVPDRYQVGVHNSSWDLNADTTLVLDIMACSGQIKFALRADTLSGQQIWHTFKGARLQSITGVAGSHLRVEAGPNGRAVIVGQLTP